MMKNVTAAAIAAAPTSQGVLKGRFIRFLPHPALLPGPAGTAANIAFQGLLRPSLSWLLTQSPASTADPSETSPASTTAATISASRSALPGP